MTRSSEAGHLVKLVDSGIDALQGQADSPLSQIYAQCLKAGHHLYEGRHDRAGQCLAQVIADSRTLGLDCLQAVAQLQRDTLATEPVPEVPDYFETHQLPDPHRSVQTLIPGAKPLLDL